MMDANKGQKRQSCLDNERIYGQPLPRVNPKNWVFNIISLLYPFSTSTPNADDLVTGVLDAPSRSVWVFDQEQQMVLWRKGFFGKGNLSRSEPTWLKREINRLQVEKKGGKELTAEELTAKRRMIRKQFKQQRAEAVAAAEAEAEVSFASNPDVAPIITTLIPSTQTAGLNRQLQTIISAGDDEPLPELTVEETPNNMEHLQLSLPEAFFLAWTTSCLIIREPESGEPISLPDFWTKCQNLWSPLQLGRIDNPFLVQYVAYHHFRALGWVVKSGIKFCVDYLLYKKGPVFHHAEFAVVIIPSYTDAEDRETSPYNLPNTEPISWQWFSTLNRANAQVMKTLVLAYVTIPSSKSLSPGILKTPELRECETEFNPSSRLVTPPERDFTSDHMSEFELSSGFCAKANVVDTSEGIPGPPPVVQILSIKKIAGGTGNVATDRHRVILSDGLQFMQAMLSTSANERVEDGTFRRNAVMTLTKWEPQNLKGSRILIIFGMEPVGYPSEKIGSPVNVGKSATAAADDGMAVDKPTVATVSTSTVPPPRPAVHAASASKVAAEKVGPIFPIEGLNPYHNKWTLKARVILKSEKKKWSNAKGEGQLFSVTLMDETGEIKATAFNSAVDQLYDVLEEGKVFYITKGKVVLARKNFSTINNDYEITFDTKTEVTPCLDAGSVPEVTYAYVDLANLGDRQKDDVVDVIAVVHKVQDVQEILTKQGKQLAKRELTLADRSGYTCQLTLWGKQAEQWTHDDNPVVACKGLKVSDFGGRALSASSSSTMHVNADTPEAHTLRGWYEGEGKNMSFQNHSSGSGGGMSSRNAALNRDEIKTLQEVRESDLGMRDTADYFTARATIISIKHENIAYAACKGETCNKKVTDTGNGWRCEKCDQTWDKAEYRYLLGMQVSDHTTQAWLQAFNDVGAEIIGMSADKLMEIKEEDEARFVKVVQKAHSKVYNFSCRAKQDTYQEKTRVRYGVNKAYPLDFAAECRNLHKMMANYSELIPARYLS